MSRPPPPPQGASPPPAAPASAEGEARAWVEEHLDAVYRYARRRLPHADAEDVVVESFLALFEARAAGRGPDEPAAYLFGVARRRVADRRRRLALHREPLRLPPGWEGFCTQPLPPEALGDRELAGLVTVALGLLGAAERALLLARYRDGVPLAAIAEREGTTAKAVEMRLYRAREALRRRLLEVGAEPDPAPRSTGSGPTGSLAAAAEATRPQGAGAGPAGSAAAGSGPAS